MTKEDLKTIPNTPGIYCITNNINGKNYIGQSVTLKDRLNSHINTYLSKRYPQRHLYRAIEKYGIENFKISVLVYVNDIIDKKELKKELNRLEIYYIQKFNSYGTFGYNETKGGESTVGWNQDLSARVKISISNKEYAKQKSLEILEKHIEGEYEQEDYYHSIPTVAININNKEVITGFSRTHVANQINCKYNTKIKASDICRVINDKNLQSNGFIFANTEKECLEKLKEINTDSSSKLKHSSLYAPNYQKYLEYLISVCDDRGYIPSTKELGNYFNRKANTISGWNNKIREELELDLKYNRLRLKNYSNPNIHYELKLNPTYNGSDI